MIVRIGALGVFLLALGRVAYGQAAPGGMPMPQVNPNAAAGCSIGMGRTELRGVLPSESRGDQPVSVTVMPETPLSLAYVRSVALAFSPDRGDPKMVARAHGAVATNDALTVAVHQADLVNLMHVTRPSGGTFSCSGLGDGKFLVLATTARGYAPKGDVAKYVARSNKFEFFVAEAIAKKNARMVSPGRFYRLGETAGAP